MTPAQSQTLQAIISDLETLKETLLDTAKADSYDTGCEVASVNAAIEALSYVLIPF